MATFRYRLSWATRLQMIAGGAIAIVIGLAGMSSPEIGETAALFSFFALLLGGGSILGGFLGIQQRRY